MPRSATGPADPLAVTIRGERDLAARDAGQRALLLVQLVGDGVGVDAALVDLDAARAAAVFLGHRRRAARHVDQPELHRHAGRGLPDAADDHAVGAELLPPIERHLLDRRRLRNRCGRCRAGSCRTLSRIPDRPTAPRRSSCAAAWVSASLVSAMNGGTAIFGGRLGSPPLIAPTTSLWLLRRRRRVGGRLLSGDARARAHGTSSGSGRQDREVISAENRKSGERSASSR